MRVRDGLLGLELDDPGFVHTVWRKRVLDLMQAGARTDSTHVLAAVRTLNRISKGGAHVPICVAIDHENGG